MKIKLLILTIILTISSFFSFGQDRHQDDRDRKPNHHGQYNGLKMAIFLLLGFLCYNDPFLFPVKSNGTISLKLMFLPML